MFHPGTGRIYTRYLTTYPNWLMNTNNKKLGSGKKNEKTKKISGFLKKNCILGENSPGSFLGVS